MEAIACRYFTFTQLLYLMKIKYKFNVRNTTNHGNFAVTEYYNVNNKAAYITSLKASMTVWKTMFNINFLTHKISVILSINDGGWSSLLRIN